MKNQILTIFLIISSLNIFAQQQEKHVINYYVGGLLYCKYTYYLDPEHTLESYLEVTNTQNYNGKNYLSCRTCRYQNEYKVNVLTFADTNTGRNFTLYIRDIDKQTCILIFQDSEKNEDKMEVYYAKQSTIK